MADTDRKWESYTETILEFFADPDGDAAPAVRIDLRADPPAWVPPALAAIGLDEPFGVFTAENPCGENVEDAPSGGEAARRASINAARRDGLEAALGEIGVRWTRVDGVAPDGSYREHCVAAVVRLDAAAELARALDQLALFWFDGRRFWLLPAEAEEPPRPLP
ncbi:MAG TPA: DUF3293 domain-containing protein [Gemmatimonadaceae bacterium]|nr:DUF3293 domain-containing protein [Gemmatimonadaceae bacterium]